jgi:hypothetical protein
MTEPEEPLDHYVIAFSPRWQIEATPVYGPFRREDALSYQARWEVIPGWTMKVVQVIEDL